MTQNRDQFTTSFQQGPDLLFDKSVPGACAVGLPKCDVPSVDRHQALGTAAAKSPPPLPQIGELDLVRHYTRLAHRCFSIDENFYPLGSCTMKYNPRINERTAALPGLAQLHPYQDDADVQGMLELLYRLRLDLAEIAGLAEVCLQPAAGAHGEMTGLMVINAFHRDQGQPRSKVLAPDSAHGTNPATCTLCCMTHTKIRSRDDGRMDLDALRNAVDQDTAALMLTYPNTVGIFDEQMDDIAQIVHGQGALLYMDGANLNAMLGVTQPGQFGVDVMHFNTHKTFSTPHGCGGPGGGPVAVTQALQPYLPVPQVVRRDDGTFTWDHDRPKSIGKVRSFFGQIGVLVRAYTYIRSLGCDGLLDVAHTAVLNANYLAARLKDHYELPFLGPYAHEFIAVPGLGDPKIQNVDVAKRLLDFGIHPPTMSWPIQHCLMIEPTETESKATLDAFIQAMLTIADEATRHPQRLTSAPHTTPIGRMDEVSANRNLDVRWRPK